MKRFVQILFVAISFILCSAEANAQWVKTNGPYGGRITSLAISGRNLFAGTYGGVWRRPLSEMITDVNDKEN